MVSELSLAAAFWMSAVSGSWPIPAAVPAGHWTGSGRIVVNWTTSPTLRFDLTITPDGAVTGRIGDAKIATGRIIENSSTSRLLSHAQYQIAVSLDGPVLANDSISRKRFTLQVSSRDGLLTGFGTTDGNKSLPGMSVLSRRDSAAVQVTGVILRPAEREPPDWPKPIS